MTMITTITLNGAAGSRFLAQLGTLYRDAMPAALVEALVERGSADLAASAAEELASFIDSVLAEGIVDAGPPPILFSPEPGDHVVVARDALVQLEVGKKSRPLWCSLTRGTRGRMVARYEDRGRVFVKDGPFAQQYVFMTDRCMTRERTTV